MGDHNYCRNPDAEPGPWCYNAISTNPRWEQCDIPDLPYCQLGMFQFVSYFNRDADLTPLQPILASRRYVRIDLSRARRRSHIRHPCGQDADIIFMMLISYSCYWFYRRFDRDYFQCSASDDFYSVRVQYIGFTEFDVACPKDPRAYQDTSRLLRELKTSSRDSAYQN
eukprot:sb/3472353/